MKFGVRIGSIVPAIAVVLTVSYGTAKAEKVKLDEIERRTSTNIFATGDTDGGCVSTLGTPIPLGQAFAIQDIQCQVTLAVRPLPIEENMGIIVVDGNACSGAIVYDGTFSSIDGLHYSPNLPLFATTGNLTVRAFRAAPNNTGSVTVSCLFSGTFEKLP